MGGCWPIWMDRDRLPGLSGGATRGGGRKGSRGGECEGGGGLGGRVHACVSMCERADVLPATADLLMCAGRLRLFKAFRDSV